MTVLPNADFLVFDRNAECRGPQRRNLKIKFFTNTKTNYKYTLNYLLSRPLVYCLLTSKTRATYFELFAKIRRAMSDLNLTFDPDIIVTDFEIAVIEATKQHFPRARHVGCFFHFGQALWRKVQDVYSFYLLHVSVFMMFYCRFV